MTPLLAVDGHSPRMADVFFAPHPSWSRHCRQIFRCSVRTIPSEQALFGRVGGQSRSIFRKAGIFRKTIPLY
jgi:hypothetical protein